MKIIAIINATSEDRAVQERNLSSFARNNGVELSEITILRLEGNPQDYDTEEVLEQLTSICEGADMVMCPGNDTGCELAVKLGSRLGGSSLIDVLEMSLEGDILIASKKVYAGNLLADYRLTKKPWCVAADRSLEDDSNFEKIPTNIIILASNRINEGAFRDRIITSIEVEAGLSQAPFVLACGQGFNKKAAVDEAAGIASRIGAQLGASRPVVMNAWAPLSSLIGVSGSMIKPTVCMTAAASGAPAFFAGIEKSKTIIAINTDEHAQIMGKADLAVKGDARLILQALADKITEE